MQEDRLTMQRMIQQNEIGASDLAAIDLTPLKEYVSWTPNNQYFEEAAGREHYRLIAFISSQLAEGSVIVDVGTYLGLSAAAAAFNKNVSVITYDIFDHLPPKKKTVRDLANVEIRVGNCLMDMAEIATKAALVVLDVDPHDGLQETEIIHSLVVQHGYKGLILLDDINLNKEMQQFYKETVDKLGEHGYRAYDLTPLGHFSGTALFSRV